MFAVRSVSKAKRHRVELVGRLALALSRRELHCLQFDIDGMSFETVLISGVGIAGPTLAFWLRRGGFEPTLLECAPGLRSGGYVIDFWGLGYDIAERMGL